jgi:hypothetical protein
MPPCSGHRWKEAFTSLWVRAPAYLLSLCSTDSRQPLEPKVGHSCCVTGRNWLSCSMTRAVPVAFRGDLLPYQLVLCVGRKGVDVSARKSSQWMTGRLGDSMERTHDELCRQSVEVDPGLCSVDVVTTCYPRLVSLLCQFSLLHVSLRSSLVYASTSLHSVLVVSPVVAFPSHPCAH